MNAVKKIIFRVNGNNRIGMGHVRRCLALAEQLKKNMPCDIAYLMKDSRIGKKYVLRYGYKILSSFPKNNADILITSLPQMSEEDIAELREKTKMLVCLDDSGRTQFPEGIIVRGSIVPELCKFDSTCLSTFLTGSDYMVLDKQFQDYHKRSKGLRPKVQSILVTMGGSDISNFTPLVMRALEKMDLANVKKTVVIGPAFPGAGRFLKHKDFIFKRNVSNMAELMFQADIVIAGGGMVLYELACVGTPGIILCQTDYQFWEARSFEKEGVVLNVGSKADFSEEKLITKIEELMRNYQKRKEMSAAGKSLVDGLATERIIAEIKREIGYE